MPIDAARNTGEDILAVQVTVINATEYAIRSHYVFDWNFSDHQTRNRKSDTGQKEYHRK